MAAAIAALAAAAVAAAKAINHMVIVFDISPTLLFQGPYNRPHALPC